METIIIQAESGKAKALKEFLKAFDIPFRVGESQYDADFVKKILKRSKSAQEGNTIVYDENLKLDLFGKDEI